MKTLKLIAAMILTSGLAMSTVNAQSNSVKYEVDFQFWVPCANGGAGEFAVGTLNLHEVSHVNKDGLITPWPLNPQGGVLVGQETGTVYHPAGAAQEVKRIDPFHYTLINNVVFVGVGKDAVSFKIHQFIRVRFNARGELMVDENTVTITCE